MGGCTFGDLGRGKTAQEAFDDAHGQACYDYGHAGYTGTLAEKSSFVEIDCPEGVTPEDYGEQLIDDNDPRIDDKWGPAGCIKVEEGKYYFFGWASS